MDPLDDLLRGVRADGALFDRSVLTPPKTLRLGGGASLTLCVPLRGEVSVRRGGERRTLRPGDVAVVRGPEPFAASAAAGSAGDTTLLAGVYRVRSAVPSRLLRMLPGFLLLREEYDWTVTRDHLEAAVAVAGPAHQVVLDRLLDWLLVCTLRQWFDRPDADPPAWYRALGDPVVGPALRAMHERPGQAWTLAALAAEAGVSRTTLAKRFPEAVGESPMSYLTGWRMALAADLLAESRATVASVARRVGYADAFGFSAAFKRTRGVSPTAFRADANAAADTEADAEAVEAVRPGPTAAIVRRPPSDPKRDSLSSRGSTAGR
ncbi:AraC family transcriptional regulator [Streptomyces amakusaensis]|uniref:AraC family transcriptional regulator n=1 Tax=Streptomyces amakusaensis TaxID=67271 RepID=A0ABW0ARN8_9ACTN